MWEVGSVGDGVVHGTHKGWGLGMGGKGTSRGYTGRVPGTCAHVCMYVYTHTCMYYSTYYCDRYTTDMSTVVAVFF